MRRKRSEPSTIHLLLQLPGQIAALVKAEYANAKREMSSAVKKLVIALICAIVALFLLFWALAAFGASAILGLATVLAPWLSALIVGAGLVVLAVVAVLVGWILIKRSNPVPEETLGRVGDDLAVAGSIKYNTEPDSRIADPVGVQRGRTRGGK